MITSEKGKEEGFLVTVGRDEGIGKTVISVSREARKTPTRERVEIRLFPDNHVI